MVGAALIAIAVPATAAAFPLTSGDVSCANGLIKGSRKVIGTYGKTAVGCVKDIGRERAGTSDPAACVAADPRARLLKARLDHSADVINKCPVPPYPMDCTSQCAGTDSGGASAQIDDRDELDQCLQCAGPAASWSGNVAEQSHKGLHGQLLDGVTLATSSTDEALSRCQARVARRYEKAFATGIKEVSACARKAFKNPGIASPPDECLTQASQSKKLTRALDKLGEEITECGAGPVFDAGVCGGLSGHPGLTGCIGTVVDCVLCRWSNTVLGAGTDCDVFDDGSSNSSCDIDPSVTTTLPPSTTTTVGATTTTTLGATTTTTSTTTTLPTGPCGAFVLQWGSFGTGNGQFNGPRGVALGSGNVYVADSRNDRLQFFTPTGSFIGKWGSHGQGGGEFDRPRGISAAPGADVWVADRTNHRIQKFTSSGAFLLEVGDFGTGNGFFNQPRDVAVDAAGNVYVADSGNNRIQKFSSSGTFMAKWGSFGTGNGQFNLPRGVAVDGSSNVYVADRDNHRVQKFTSAGSYVTKWGSFGSANGSFNGPRGVGIDVAGNVFVADSGNNRVQVFTSGGGYLDKWGSGGSGAGQFSSPRGVAIDGAGAVYVSDLDNHRVQKFTCPSP